MLHLVLKKHDTQYNTQFNKFGHSIHWFWGFLSRTIIVFVNRVLVVALYFNNMVTPFRLTSKSAIYLEFGMQNHVEAIAMKFALQNL